MIKLIRVDYRGTTGDVTVNRITEFVAEIQKQLETVADEINQQQAILVIKVYDGKRLTFSFENISKETLARINLLSRP
jgi:hypothetical protein